LNKELETLLIRRDRILSILQQQPTSERIAMIDELFSTHFLNGVYNSL
jgi:hypothetical protein